MRKNAILKRRLRKNIKRARKAVGLSQEELAFKIKVSRAYIGYIEQGRNIPSLKILEKIARAL